jgi:ribonuclease HI
MRWRKHICSDSRAALVALRKTTTESSLVWKCMQVLGKFCEFNKVTLVWIPGHQEIPDKEADKLAKEGATEVPPNQFTATPFSVGKKFIEKLLELRHQARWTTCTSC